MTADGLLAFAWKDVGNTKGMSNFHLPALTTVFRRARGVSGRVERSAPVLFEEYNRFMGGTDLCDQRRGQYSTQRRSKKWWHALFYFSLDILMVRARTHTHTHTHTDSHSPTQPLNHTAQQLGSLQLGNRKNMKQKLFILSVAKDLLQESDPDLVQDNRHYLLSPAAKNTPPAPRFFCRKEQMGSIAKSKHYK